MERSRMNRGGQGRWQGISQIVFVHVFNVFMMDIMDGHAQSSFNMDD